MVLKIEIEGAMRIKNPLNELEPPSSFVFLRLPFKHARPSELETPVI